LRAKPDYITNHGITNDGSTNDGITNDGSTNDVIADKDTNVVPDVLVLPIPSRSLSVVVLGLERPKQMQLQCVQWLQRVW